MPKMRLVAVGNAAMDAQHHLLMDLLNKVLTALRDGRDGGNFVRNVLEFRASLATHFAAEEGGLKANGFPRYDDHVAKHRQIIEKIDDAIAALNLVASTSARFAIVNEIEECLYSHEIVEDSEYAGLPERRDAAYAWEESLSVGVPWIDEQHRGLFAMLNILREFVQAENWKVSKFIYDRFLAHVRQHFDDEEMHMQHIGADVLNHRRLHLHALLSLEEMWDSSDGAALVKIDEFIFYWLREHIVLDDIRDLRQ